MTDTLCRCGHPYVAHATATFYRHCMAPDCPCFAFQSQPVDPEHLDWNAIAAYVQGVAVQAFLHGYSDGWRDGDGSADVLNRNRSHQARAAQQYTATGFDPDTVRRYHPLGGDVA